MAQFYYTLRALDAQVQILTENVASFREQVRILSAQLKSGLVSPIVLYQAQAQLQATLAQLRDVERARADQEHALAILCGRPAPLFTVASNPLHEASPPDVPPGLPAQLLARRPDVAEGRAECRCRQRSDRRGNRRLLSYLHSDRRRRLPERRRLEHLQLAEPRRCHHPQHLVSHLSRRPAQGQSRGHRGPSTGRPSPRT